MDEKKMESVSYVVYESSQTRSDRIINRLIIALFLSITLMFISNLFWLWAWSSHEETQTTVEDSNYIGDDGVINSNG